MDTAEAPRGRSGGNLSPLPGLVDAAAVEPTPHGVGDILPVLRT
jgi:hypothetical protein